MKRKLHAGFEEEMKKRKLQLHAGFEEEMKKRKLQLHAGFEEKVKRKSQQSYNLYVSRRRKIEKDPDSENATNNLKGPESSRKVVGMRCSFHNLQQIAKILNFHQRKLVEELGFGSLLEAKNTRVGKRELAVWLLQRLDVSLSALVVNPEKILYLNDVCVQKVLGIPRGPVEFLENNAKDDCVAELRNMFHVKKEDKLDFLFSLRWDSAGKVTTCLLGLLC